MKKTNETGRSMVEMLGVLAIIGVLSIGGIAGYTMAMNKYQANEIVNTITQAAVHCRTRGTIPQDLLDTLSNLGVTMTSPAGCTRSTGTVTWAWAAGDDAVDAAVQTAACKLLGIANEAGNACGALSYTPDS